MSERVRKQRGFEEDAKASGNQTESKHEAIRKQKRSKKLRKRVASREN